MCLVRLILFILFATQTGALHASYTLKNGKLVNTNEVATLSVQEHYSLAMQAYQKEKWDELAKQTTIIIKNFSGTSFASEAQFYLGIANFHLGDYDVANEEFSEYLKIQVTPKHFEEAIQYKFKIAEKFKNGSRKHILGWGKMPKWLPAKEDAIAIYDEVITALPHEDLAAEALFSKAFLLCAQEEYESSIETYQTLIRRFSKKSLAAESYIGIAKVYLTQCEKEFASRDFLDLAEINLIKFKLDFPGEERVSVAEQMHLQMKEIYASSLYETGKFYERTKKIPAALIYFNKVLTHFPETKIAAHVKKRLDRNSMKQTTSSPLEKVLATREELSAPMETTETGSAKEQENVVSLEPESMAKLPEPSPQEDVFLEEEAH